MTRRSTTLHTHMSLMRSPSLVAEISSKVIDTFSQLGLNQLLNQVERLKRSDGSSQTT
jgi:hypothetical protein